MIKWRLCQVASTVCAALLGSTAAAAAPGAMDEVLFSSNRADGVFELYRMAADGKRVERAVGERGEAHDMSWSPDGTQIVYTARRGSGIDIFVTATADGKTRRLTHEALPSSAPAWSPDGKAVVFVSMRDGTRKIYVMDADGGGLRRVTDSSDDELAPSFSPDGTQVAYLAATATTTPRVAVANLATGKSTFVSRDQGRSFESPPVWSPDGKRLLFSSIRGRNAQLVSIAADGSALTQLTRGDSRNNDPQWSPDGRQILFMAVRAGSPRQGIYVMNADGSGEKTISDDGSEHAQARWSADGRRIYFVKLLTEGGKVYSIGADGTQPRRLSGDEGSDIAINLCCSKARERLASLR